VLDPAEGEVGCDEPAGSLSQLNRSPLGRLWTPVGPFSQVVTPSVKAVTSSISRHTSRPPVVRCSTFPSSELKCSSSRQLPTVSGPTRSRRAAKPEINRKEGWAPVGVCCHQNATMVASMTSVALIFANIDHPCAVTVYLVRLPG